MIVAPYEDRDGWNINVIRLNGVLYLEEHLTDAQLEAKYVCAPIFLPVSLTSPSKKQPRAPPPPIDILRLFIRILVHLRKTVP